MATFTFAPTLSFGVKQRIFNRRDLIPLQPNVLWKIENGAVRTLTYSEEGKAIALGFWGSGDVVGKPLSRLEVYEVECLTCVTASIMPRDRTHESFDTLLLNIQQATELFSIIRRERVYLRLWKFLVWLAQKFGRDINQGRLIELRLTHQDIAEAISSSRVTVTRLLNQLELDGIISRHQYHLVVLRF